MKFSVKQAVAIATLLTVLVAASAVYAEYLTTIWSNPVYLTVTKPTAPTYSITLTIDGQTNESVTEGTPVTLAAVVSSVPASTIPNGGLVHFWNASGPTDTNMFLIGSNTTLNGVATYTFTPTAGNYEFWANYTTPAGPK